MPCWILQITQNVRSSSIGHHWYAWNTVLDDALTTVNLLITCMNTSIAHFMEGLLSWDKFKKLTAQWRQLAQGNADPRNYSLDNCDCGWTEYRSSILGGRFPCIHETQNGILGNTPQAPDLDVIDYEHVNHFVLKMTNTKKAVPGKRKDRFPSSFRQE